MSDSDPNPNGYSTLQEPQQQQQQSERSGEELMHGGVVNSHPSQQQSVQQLPPDVNAGAIPSGTPLQHVAGSGISPRSGVDLPQGPGSPQPNIVQPTPSYPHTNSQPSLATSALLNPQPVSVPPDLMDVPLPRLCALNTRLLHAVMNGERYLQATTSSGEGDIQRQQIRAKIELSKRLICFSNDLISMKMRASGGPAQQTVNGPWRSNSTQISSHVSAHGPPPNGVLAPMNGAPPYQSLHITQPPSRPIQLFKLPCYSEGQFYRNFMQFTIVTGIRLSERDLVIDGRRINLWVLHRMAFSRGGFNLVSARGEWPVIGAALGFPPVSADRLPARCGPVIAQRLQQLYNDVLRHFDQIYMSSIVARLTYLRESGQLPPQQELRHEPTETDYQELFASINSDTSVISTKTMGILLRFYDTPVAELEAHHVPQHVITYVEENRENLRPWIPDPGRFHRGSIFEEDIIAMLE